jgi:hypothetical protein
MSTRSLLMSAIATCLFHNCAEPLQHDEDKIAMVLNEEVIVGNTMSIDGGPLQSYWLAYDGHNNIAGLYKEEVLFKASL